MKITNFPNDWVECPFGEFAIFTPKITLKKGNEYSFIPMEDVNPGNRFIKSEKLKKYTGGGAKFGNGDTLFARITPCLENGKIAQTKDMVTNEGFGSTEYFVFRGKEGISDSDFIYYLCKTQWFQQNAINSMVGASGRQRADAKFIGKTSLSLPLLPTQQKIAHILSAYDELIENNLKRIKLLEEMAQIIYEQWFVRMKFPGYETTPVDAETGLPEGWANLSVGSLLEHQIGGGWGKDELSQNFSEPAFVIRGTDFNNITTGNISNVPFRFHKKSNLESRMLRHGDIIFEVSGGSHFAGVARAVFVDDELLNQFDDSVMCASFCKLVRADRTDIAYLLYHFFRFLRSIKATEVFEIRSASNIVNYNWTAFLKFQNITVPSEEILSEFQQVIAPIHTQLFQFGKQNQCLKEARDILLPRLMTGMINVDHIELPGLEQDTEAA